MLDEIAPESSDNVDANDTNDTVLRVKLRNFKIEDFGFIIEVWRRSYKATRSHVPHQEYWPGQHQTIVRLAEKERIIIACDADQPDLILGFICFHSDGTDLTAEGNAPATRKLGAVDPIPSNLVPLIVHYLYVKPLYRELGLARTLMEAAGWHKDRVVFGTNLSYKARDFEKKIKLYPNEYVLLNYMYELGREHGLRRA